jgi:diphthamide biosynthesis protein 2
MAGTMSTAPVLSTPDSHIWAEVPNAAGHHETLSDEELEVRYEIARTVDDIKQHGWRKVALQFPDDMLSHSVRVYQMLARGIKDHATATSNGTSRLTDKLENLNIDEQNQDTKLTILGDTSYGSCCVDEIAAEHVDADAVVHYGRACLSPTARLPTTHVFTQAGLNHEVVLKAFQEAFSDLATKVVLTSDAPYSSHVLPIAKELASVGYSSVFAASIVHDPSSAIPNRSVPPEVYAEPSSLSTWHMFHLSEPPTSLLLTLSASMASIKVFPTVGDPAAAKSAVEMSTAVLLRRRYALVTSLSTVPVWGILINTLSVKNYLHMVEHVKRLIADARKKSYLFVVGKINAAKVANFSEIGGWVVIGCWESSLIDSKEFYKPIITPFELQLSLSPDSSRVWSGRWRSDFDSALEAAHETPADEADSMNPEAGDESDSSASESEAPEFDLRTGRYVTKTRPMGKPRRAAAVATLPGSPDPSSALAKRANGDIVAVNGVASPAAEYLANSRSWRGLEVKYDEDEEGGLLEEGRTGIASGYLVGEADKS